MSPHVLTCSYSGLVFGIFTLKNIFLFAVVGALLYYGWPVVEAIIIKLPIPDPKDMKERV